MSHMNELSQALDELVACGEGMIKAANAIRAAFSESPEPEAETPAAEEPRTYTFAEVRKAFAAKSHAGHTEQIRSLIARYGADKLSAVKEEDYTQLMKDLEGIG